jgi:hypothetical protein
MQIDSRLVAGVFERVCRLADTVAASDDEFGMIDAILELSTEGLKLEVL